MGGAGGWRGDDVAELLRVPRGGIWAVRCGVWWRMGVGGWWGVGGWHGRRTHFDSELRGEERRDRLRRAGSSGTGSRVPSPGVAGVAARRGSGAVVTGRLSRQKAMCRGNEGSRPPRRGGLSRECCVPRVRRRRGRVGADAPGNGDLRLDVLVQTNFSLLASTSSVLAPYEGTRILTR